MERVLARWTGVTITQGRALQVGTLLILLTLGTVLPYVTLEHLNFTVELVRSRERLFGAANLLGGMDPASLPSFNPVERERMNVALNVMAAAPGLQEVATVAAALSCWGLFADEINKFFWWPLHLSAYLLVVVPLPLFVGLHLLRSTRATVSVGPAWVPAVLAGVLILVVTFRARGRIDTYRGF